MEGIAISSEVGEIFFRPTGDGDGDNPLPTLSRSHIGREFCHRPSDA